MRLLSYAQTLAGARLSPAARADWFAADAKVMQHDGKRGGKAVW